MCSDSGAQENQICHCFYFFPSICHEVIVSDAIILVSRILSFKPAFHSSLLASSRGSLVPFEFLPLEWYHLHIWGCWYFSQQSWSQIRSHPAPHLAWCTLVSLMVQMVKKLSAMQETHVLPLGWEDPLEKRMATGSSILAWRIPWTEEPGGLQSAGSQTDGRVWAINTHSVYRLNKQGDNIWSCCTPFPIVNQSVVPCKVLTVAFWHAYRFFRRQVRWSGIPISLRIFHSLLWSTQSKPFM